MPNLADLLDGDLDSFSHADVARIVESLSDETHRVDLKREWPTNRDLSHDVCAFANGLGGAIIIGYDDPKRGSVPQLGVDGTSARIDSAFAAIHALTWPSVHCLIRSFSDPTTKHVAVVITVPSTTNGPHECIGVDKSSNLPIRRGRSTKALTLSEIFALRRKAESVTRERPNIGEPIISLDNLSGPFWGIEFTPTDWPEDGFVFGHDDDLLFQNYWRDRFDPSLQIHPNGIELSYKSHDLLFFVATHVDGTIAMWWRTNYRPWMHYVAFIDLVYGYASTVFSHLHLSPRATMRVRWSVSGKSQDDKFPFSASGELVRRVDFSHDNVDDVLTFFTEQADRRAQRSRPRSVIESEIRNSRGSEIRDDPRNRWGTT